MHAISICNSLRFSHLLHQRAVAPVQRKATRALTAQVRQVPRATSTLRQATRAAYLIGCTEALRWCDKEHVGDMPRSSVFLLAGGRHAAEGLFNPRWVSAGLKGAFAAKNLGLGVSYFAAAKLLGHGIGPAAWAAEHTAGRSERCSFGADGPCHGSGPAAWAVEDPATRAQHGSLGADELGLGQLGRALQTKQAQGHYTQTLACLAAAVVVLVPLEGSRLLLYVLQATLWLPYAAAWVGFRSATCFADCLANPARASQWYDTARKNLGVVEAAGVSPRAAASHASGTQRTSVATQTRAKFVGDPSPLQLRDLLPMVASTSTAHIKSSLAASSDQRLRDYATELDVASMELIEMDIRLRDVKDPRWDIHSEVREDIHRNMRHDFPRKYGIDVAGIDAYESQDKLSALAVEVREGPIHALAKSLHRFVHHAEKLDAQFRRAAIG